MKQFYKATRPDGLSFHASPNGLHPRYLPGDHIVMPESRRRARLCTDGILHASDEGAETLNGGGVAVPVVRGCGQAGLWAGDSQIRILRVAVNQRG